MSHLVFGRSDGLLGGLQFGDNGPMGAKEELLLRRAKILRGVSP